MVLCEVHAPCRYIHGTIYAKNMTLTFIVFYAIHVSHQVMASKAVGAATIILNGCITFVQN